MIKNPLMVFRYFAEKSIVCILNLFRHVFPLWEIRALSLVFSFDTQTLLRFPSSTCPSRSTSGLTRSPKVNGVRDLGSNIAIPRNQPEPGNPEKVQTTSRGMFAIDPPPICANYEWWVNIDRSFGVAFFGFKTGVVLWTQNSDGKHLCWST